VSALGGRRTSPLDTDGDSLRHHLSFGLVLCAAVSAAACTGAVRPDAAILLFSGPGTSPGDVAAVQHILRDNHFDYETVSATQLNAMSEAQLRSHQLLIVPGGNFLTMGESWTPRTAANIHDAVQHGLNYLGICAGGFLAGRASYRSLDLASGARFGFYAAESLGIHKAAVAITAPGMPALEHYWEDGPQLTGWGDVVARYTDGTPAIVEGFSGQGWVVLLGIHPEAPESWRRGMTFTTPASVDNAYAATLIQAALRRTALPHD
jgi:glutamine amidotransferase-like uncharacterized protein